MNSGKIAEFIANIRRDPLAVCEYVHNAIARFGGGAIGWVWKKSAVVPLRLRLMLGLLVMGASVAWAGWFLSFRFVEWAQFSKENVRVLYEAGFVAEPPPAENEASSADENPAAAATNETLAAASPVQEEVAADTVGEASAPVAGADMSASMPEAPAETPHSPGELDRYVYFTLVAAGLCVLAALLAVVPAKFVYFLLEAAYAAWLLAVLGAMRLAFTVPAVLYAADYKLFDKLSRNAIWTASLGVFAPFALLGLLMLLALSLSTVRRLYKIGKNESAGDRIVEAFRTGGSDPRYRTSWYWAVGLCLFVLVAPFIFRGCDWEDPYGLIQGSGTPELQVVKVKKIKKEKKKKKYILNKWSPYILERAKIDDNKNLEEMENETQDQYVADQPAKKGGKLGKGGGKTGGWPKGLADAKVRFIRLEYAGGDWDQDMGKSADYNLLIKFHKITGFPIWKDTESRPISRLSKFPKHYAPPFVFLTGSRGINVSNSDIAELRKYLVDEGGMLFIDNGGGNFGGAVRRLVARIFPDKPFIDIPNDDPIYQQPYSFPDGAPPFWHHDGTRARGIRIGERIAVFYHPGDINDAWKDGHSGASEAVAEQAFKLGINVMYYAFNAYYARHFEGATDGGGK